jgi:carboxymethylenebutenolidase
MCHEAWRPKPGVSEQEPVTYPIRTADGALMPGWRYRTADSRCGPVLLLPDIYGPSPFYRRVASLLAGEGYDVVVSDYLFRLGPLSERTRSAAYARRGGMDEPLAIQDISGALDLLGRETNNARIGLIGFCLSGHFALNLTTTRSDIATVCYYGFPEGMGGEVKVAADRPVDLVKRMSGPILAQWGDADFIPLEAIDRFASAMTGSLADYTHVVHPGAGHGFLQGLVEDRQDSAHAADAWRRTLDFLAAHLGSTTELTR